MSRTKRKRAMLKNSIPMIAGFIGELMDIDYREIKNTKLRLTADQIVTINDEGYVIARAGDKPHALTFIFSDRTITLDELITAQEHSTIQFNDGVKPFNKLDFEDMTHLLRKTLQCTSVQQMPSYYDEIQDKTINPIAYKFEEVKLS